MKRESLGDRMKNNYEDRYRFYLQRRTHTIIRIDGKAFHSYTKNLNKPFDFNLIEDLNQTVIFLCEQIQGAKFAYVQSDEISILLHDYDDIDTNAWFDNNLQKIVSVSASLATAKFNELRNKRGIKSKLALFDSRAFQIADIEEVINYFVWRQQDWTRNSITMLTRSMYSHKEVSGKNISQMQDMCMEKNVNWNNLETFLKRGRMIVKKSVDGRSKWLVDNEMPIITQDRDYMKNMIIT